MEFASLDPGQQKAAEDVLGYLNFGSGSHDPRFLANLNQVFTAVAGEAPPAGSGKRAGSSPIVPRPPAWRELRETLDAALAALHVAREAFQQVEQARAVLPLVFDVVLPGYRAHHRDLLHHQSDEQLFTSFFIGLAAQAVLQQGPPWEQSERILRGTLTLLNNYIGYRPVAVLRTEQKVQPYEHEWVCPIPLFLRGAGTAFGRYQGLIDRALGLLETTDPAMLFRASFDPELLDELAMDPRAYDFDHPNNRRPNYLFGQWDLMRLDNSGRSRRFVLQQAALDIMLERCQAGEAPAEECLMEAAAVLAGTILMGAGLSGQRPDAHDSTVTLTTLVQRIAVYRDAYYEQLLDKMRGRHSQRLREEAAERRQPFAGARQDFNQRVARRRAAQSQNVSLARLYVRMGHTPAAAAQTSLVPAASARMLCEIDCGIYAARQHLAAGKLATVADTLPALEDILQRAIGCGAMVDPWNILGFGGQYSLFPAAENSIPDPRVDDLIETLHELFSLYVDLMTEAAACGASELQQRATDGLERLAAWWDKYAADEISGVDGISGREVFESAQHVAHSLGAWHRAATAAGDIAFWRAHAEQFRSPKAYALVAAALLRQRDFVAAMALLMQWLSQHHEIELVEEEHTLHDLALDWMESLWQPKAADTREPAGPATAAERWTLSRKFLDYLEANAEDLWQVPQFELAAGEPAGKDRPAADEDAAAGDELAGAETDEGGPEREFDETVGAAYENMVFRDSADDGLEGELFDTGPAPADIELMLEGERLSGRLLFTSTVAELWRIAAVASREAAVEDEREATVAAWLRQAEENLRWLRELLAAVHRHRIPPPRGSYESLVEYDRRRSLKEGLLEQIIATCVETADAALMLRASMRVPPADAPAVESGASASGIAAAAAPRKGAAGRKLPAMPWQEVAAACLGALMRGDVAEVRLWWAVLGPQLLDLPLLYVALGRGGHPKHIVESRVVQRVVQRLLYGLPRLGMLRETDELVRLVHHMEIVHPVGPGGITEFDDVFEIACRGVCECLIVSSQKWRKTRTRHPDHQLIELLEIAVESLLQRWLDHSMGMRLSVAESLEQNAAFNAAKRFIEQYGHDLFSQQFMQMGNLRAIMHQGVDTWLNALIEEPAPDVAEMLLADLDEKLPREKAVHLLTLILESVLDYYPQYIDYNTTTTQSDRGEMLYSLLDFLRLLASYDRVAWNLRPVMLAHEELMRAGRPEAADLWRTAVAERTALSADAHQRRLQRLTRRYSMQLASVAERIGERFVRPMEIDRLRSLVEPSIARGAALADESAFAELREQIARFQQEPTSAGVDTPNWLAALENEVERCENEEETGPLSHDWLFPVPQVRLALNQLRRELRQMSDQL